MRLFRRRRGAAPASPALSLAELPLEVLQVVANHLPDARSQLRLRRVRRAFRELAASRVDRATLTLRPGAPLPSAQRFPFPLVRKVELRVEGLPADDVAPFLALAQRMLALLEPCKQLAEVEVVWEDNAEADYRTWCAWQRLGQGLARLAQLGTVQFSTQQYPSPVVLQQLAALPALHTLALHTEEPRESALTPLLQQSLAGLEALRSLTLTLPSGWPAEPQQQFTALRGVQRLYLQVGACAAPRACRRVALRGAARELPAAGALPAARLARASPAAAAGTSTSTPAAPRRAAAAPASTWTRWWRR
jgi:hypothetical protein